MAKLVIKVMIREKLKEVERDQKWLADQTELSVRTISELASGKMKRYPKEALEKIAAALDITDINEIITLVEEE